ncbi:hypothetical protein DAEQUDRAFT_479719 [Daedalea quercina L-15889]|uniref:Uncharacterized protein n=1 Tax=Daedalea quercina L-15889 TaxID=1314783 RepID=A0A165MWU6_9APHY|nr:hypothetical protein DAEQUDRAFT_479719 [Daedalea quercina L-15889]
MRLYRERKTDIRAFSPPAMMTFPLTIHRQASLISSGIINVHQDGLSRSPMLNRSSHLHHLNIEFQALLYPTGRGQRPLGPIRLPWIDFHRNGIPGWCPQLSNKADMLHGHRPSWSLACRIEASHRTQSPRRKPLNVDVRLPSPMIYRPAKCRLKLPKSRCCSQLSHFAC